MLWFLVQSHPDTKWSMWGHPVKCTGGLKNSTWRQVRYITKSQNSLVSHISRKAHTVVQAWTSKVFLKTMADSNKATWHWHDPTCLFFYINSDLHLWPWPSSLVTLTCLTFEPRVPTLGCVAHFITASLRVNGRCAHFNVKLLHFLVFVTDGQKATPKSPPCMRTGGLNNTVNIFG